MKSKVNGIQQASLQSCPVLDSSDVETNQRLGFLTNNFALPALTITQIYKCRRQVELFFKWIKPHLRIKAFSGTSENAVKTQSGSRQPDSKWFAQYDVLILRRGTRDSRLRPLTSIRVPAARKDPKSAMPHASASLAAPRAIAPGPIRFPFTTG
jgi:Transposase DDE domain